MRSLSTISVRIALAALFAVFMLVGSQAQAASHSVPEIDLDGAVGPASAEFVTNALHHAEHHGAPFVILRIDTPGGLGSSMQDIVQAILASPIPVVGYVAPEGARAASAGTYILYATHVAAMAPATHLGAATPINIGGGNGDDQSAPKQKSTKTSQKSAAKKNDTQTAAGSSNTLDLSNGATERRKQVNDAAAYIRSLAEQRGRNAQWAVHAVRDAASLTATEALKKNVIDLIADNDQALLKKLNGRQVHTQAGTVTLHTKNLTVKEVKPGLRTQILAAVTDPTVAYLLFMIGIVGLAAEAFNPGATLPGVVGGISLLTALYAFHMLPVDFTGAALVLLGVALIIAEAFVPSFGALGLGGLAALVFGSVMLMDTPAFGVSIAVIIAIALAAALMLATILWMFHRARRTRVATGHEGLLDRECEARHDFDDIGRVWLQGESWRAKTTVPVVAGQTLRVSEVKGLTVHVRPAVAHSETEQED